MTIGDPHHCPPKPLNVQQTADRLGVHTNTVRNWVASGYLTPAVLTTHPLRFDPDQVDALAAARTPNRNTPNPATTLARVELLLAQWDNTGAHPTAAAELRAALTPTALQTVTRKGATK